MARREPNKRRLSEILLQRGLRPRERSYMVWDTKQAGLAVRVEPTGYRAWKVVYRHHNRPRWYHLGAVNAIGLSEARQLASKIMFEVLQGRDPQAERRAQRGAGTFEEVALRYREEYAKKHNKSWEQAAYIVDRYVMPRLGKLRAAGVTRQDVKSLLARIESPSLQLQVIASASAIFSWAIREEVDGVAVNPCSKIERPDVDSRDRVLSESEIPRFWAAFDDAGLVVGTALRTILLTGQRPGEVAAMRREHIKDGWWEMPGSVMRARRWRGTKSGASHRVWLPEPVQKLLAGLNEDAEVGFVFPGNRGPVTNLDGAMRSICAALKIEDKVTPHDLRRTHGTTITALGFGRDAMNRIQNHSSDDEVGDVYDRYSYSAEDKRIMETVADRILSLAEGKKQRGNVVRGKFTR